MNLDVLGAMHVMLWRVITRNKDQRRWWWIMRLVARSCGLLKNCQSHTVHNVWGVCNGHHAAAGFQCGIEVALRACTLPQAYYSLPAAIHKRHSNSAELAHRPAPPRPAPNQQTHLAKHAAVEHSRLAASTGHWPDWLAANRSPHAFSRYIPKPSRTKLCIALWLGHNWPAALQVHV